MANIYGAAIRTVFSGPLTAMIALPVGPGLWIGGAAAARAVERVAVCLGIIYVLNKAICLAAEVPLISGRCIR